MVRLKALLKSNSGFSLIELIVAAGISVIISGIAVFAFMMTIDTYVRMVRQYEAEMEMVNSMMAIKTALSSAVQLNYCGDTPNAAYSTRILSDPEVTNGCIWNANYSTGSTGAANLVAMLVRDMSTGYDGESGASTVRPYSKLFGTAIYYQRPQLTRSGALYIDLERNTSGAWVKLSPVNAPFMFTRFTEFQVSNIKVVTQVGGVRVGLAAVDSGQPAISAQFRLVMRYFTQGMESSFRWEPKADLTAAEQSAMTRFYDVEKNMTVTFGNNARTPAQFLGPRGFGNMHMFKYTSGQSRSN